MVAQHGRLKMRRRVALPVTIVTVFPWHGLFESQVHIVAHIRICAFLNRHRRRSVRNDHMEQPILPAPLGGNLLQKLCDGHKFGMAPCGDCDFFHG